MRLIDRVRERRLRRCKPSVAFVEGELAMGLLDGGAVMPSGEGAVVVATVQRRRWPVAELPVADNAPSLDRLGLGCRWGVWRLR